MVVARRPVTALMLVLLAGVLLAVRGVAIGGDAPPPPVLERSKLPYLAGIERTGLPAELPTAPDLLPWSRIVFESFRGGNWDVYGSMDSGAEQERLTDNPAVDSLPRLNRGATHVVFSSDRTGDAEIYAMSADGTGEMRLTWADGMDLNAAWSPDGSRIVFESTRNGGSDIFVMNADGSGQTRLTTNPDFDGMPCWSPDGSQIAFVSRRDGQYRIWTMNADGSGAVQRSAEPNSFYPAWSPDGTTIAFAADANDDGWLELHTMRADGTAPVLVHDPGQERDILPRSWSPDGSHLAFTYVEYAGVGDDWHWTSATILAWNATLPSWSTIALGTETTDWNPDWQTTDLLPPTSRVEALNVVSPAPVAVRWSGADAGPAGIKSYDVQVQVDGGPWVTWLVDTTADEATYPGTGGQPLAFRVRARDNAHNLEPWPTVPDASTIVEDEAPLTTVLPLPAYTRTAVPFIVRWDGYDPWASGIASYDVQTRVDGGLWADLLNDSEATSTTVEATRAASQMAVRVRAEDEAGNLEPWPADPGDTSTTFYAWAIRGAVGDNTGVAVGGAAIDVSPDPMPAALSDRDGGYAGYSIGENDAFRLTWSKPGYGALPLMDVAGTADIWADVTLPPADDAVADGGFEADDLLPSWSTGGTMPPVLTTTLRHTGKQSAWLGATPWAWGEPVLVSAPGDLSPEFSLAVDNGGRGHVLWIPDGGGVIYRSQQENGDWGASASLSPSGAQPRLVKDDAGWLHALWLDERIYYTRRDLTSDGPWAPAQPIAGCVDCWDGAELQGTLVGDDGSVFVTWTAMQGTMRAIHLSRRLPGGAWAPLETVTAPETHNAHPRMARAFGSLHVCWRQLVPTVESGIYCRQRGPGGEWIEPLPLSPLDQDYDHPFLVLAADGTLHLIYSRSYIDGVFHRFLEESGWSPQREIASRMQALSVAAGANETLHIMTKSNTARAYYQGGEGNINWSLPFPLGMTLGFDNMPRLTLFEDTLHVIWSGYNFNGPRYTRRLPSGQWLGFFQPLTDYFLVEHTQLAVGPDGELILASRAIVRGEDDLRLYVVGPERAAMPGDSTLAQALVVPAVEHPVLSFRAMAGGYSSREASPFVVSVADGAGETVLGGVPPSAGGFAHRWFDLAPWAGEAVTVTFRLEQEAGQRARWAYLDEVSVGAAYPDLWVGAIDAALTPGGAAVLDVAYGNRGAVPSGPAVLTLALPPGMSFVAAVPAPVSTDPLVWDVGALAGGEEPAAIAVTIVAPEAGVGMGSVSIATTAELETLNNEAELRLDVGWRLYAPLVAR